ncbi:dna topoisomerase 2 [Quercus suber]|uniref:DNA topoisomerase (ATP-hydrolyzing) n=1 Tax=Quercus suber TaxID=58331 RepID=A0AAW0L5M4_QUESU
MELKGAVPIRNNSTVSKEMGSREEKKFPKMSLLSWATFKESKDLKKSDGTKIEKIHSIEKLDDSNKAGGKESDKCTLILTEGDSTKALAFQAYTLIEFTTPIMKATDKNGTQLSFYTMPEYESWKHNLTGNASGWSIKYYMELEKSDAQSKELRKKMRGKARGEAAMKSTRQAPKNPRKNNNKKANNAESVAEAVSSSMAAMEIERAPEAAKPKGRASSRNASAKPWRLKCPKYQPRRKKRGAANKQQPQTLGQKLLTDMLKPTENSGISPEKKVRKMRASPFNKKSGFVLGQVGKVNEVNENEENSGFASTTASTEETIEVASTRARHQRTRYVLSDSESEHATEDSEFDGVTDESEDE